jgi:hypothetical protein
MKTKCDFALDWGARGFRVFPLLPGKNTPYAGSDWTESATADPEKIRDMWRFRPDANIGVLTTDRIVLDVDCKEGKPGFLSLLDLDLPLETLTVKSPSGGHHLYFNGPNRANSAGKLGEGLDIRSFNGYVVAPGSTTPVGEYTLETDVPIQDAPESLIARLDMPRERSATAAKELVAPDRPLALHLASNYLASEAEAPDVGGRNAALFLAAAHVKDFGVSEKTALELIATLWNTRLACPLERDEIEKTVGSAYANGQLNPGSLNPEAHYAGISIPPIEERPYEPTPLKALLRFSPPTPLHLIPPRPWIVKRLLLRGFITTLVAPGGAGKSAFQLALAAHMAVGRGFAGFELASPGTPVRSLVINVEDDKDEMERRLGAVCLYHSIDLHAARKNIMLLPGTEYQFKIADGGVRQMKVRTGELRDVAQVCRDKDIRVIMGDPLIETHDVDVSDNQGLKTVMSIYRELAQKAGAAVFLAHHTSKGGGRGRAGEADSAMGAAAIVNSSRVAYTLFEATDDDVEEFKLSKAARPFLVRLDDAKSNYSAGGAGPVWLRRQGVDVPNGDSVGVLVPANIKESAVSVTLKLAQALSDEFAARNIVSATSYESAKILISVDPFWSDDAAATPKATGALARRIMNTLAREGVKLPDGTTMRAYVDKSDAALARSLVIKE